MARITPELLRRRAEHNDGCLSTLKEVALHQQDIERIEVIGDCCRQLEILYLCNNYISKIEGLRHLKWLKYINLAVNNIKVIEGLEGCEALEKLDLTLNFIEDITCVRRLLANPFLETLHLTGNPCTKTSGYRAYVVQSLPQLKDLDGNEVIKAERINARQVEEDLQEAAAAESVKYTEAERIKAEMIAQGINPFPPKYNEQGERVFGHTAEERLQMLREQQAQEEERKKKEQEPVPGSISAIHKELNKKSVPLTPEEELAKYGRHLMRNEGKVSFTIDQDSATEFHLTVQPGKFIATSLLDVQVDVHCVRVYVKGKLLQVPVEAELAADSARVQRSQTTGELKVSVPYSDGAKKQLRAKPKPADASSQKEAEPAPCVARNDKESLRKALLFPEDGVRQEKRSVPQPAAAEDPKRVIEVLAEEGEQGSILDLD
ncbi:U2 small nuclear ribonucleoprotein A' [Strigomonas culicis]|uniref:U2 small nuclear ribonucleoprotein A n=1 Tax=Strigomonas culicis TaxID=28005 RepID=S9VW95_9TRYP|nr:U2 small nuclear ribonucleoprotein A' [Strigomonas culicis]EPY29201.1 U2 small nuclear ribonucleoprotein A' [Strigomonas culicis]|eukprot:EPY27795.1 U2 small nuclear ribonucleoprotein A' [Strigomonas culicis]